MKALSEEILARMRKGNGFDRAYAAAIDAAVKAEREACAELSESFAGGAARWAAAIRIAAAIRARGGK